MVVLPWMFRRVLAFDQEIADLRQQLQSMKKQIVTVLEQSRKSSDWEQAALRQAQ
jgi:regulator of replication initiation timing